MPGCCIELDKDTRLTSDAHGWCIAVRKQYQSKATGELVEEWEGKAWYSKFEALLRGLFERRLRECGAGTLDELSRYAQAALSEATAIREKVAGKE